MSMEGRNMIYDRYFMLVLPLSLSFVTFKLIQEKKSNGLVEERKRKTKRGRERDSIRDNDDLRIWRRDKFLVFFQIEKRVMT